MKRTKIQTLLADAFAFPGDVRLDLCSSVSGVSGAATACSHEGPTHSP